MNDAVRHTLADIVTRYGRTIVDEPRRCEGFLCDLCGEHKREIHVALGVSNTAATDSIVYSPVKASFVHLHVVGGGR